MIPADVDEQWGSLTRNHWENRQVKFAYLIVDQHMIPQQAAHNYRISRGEIVTETCPAPQCNLSEADIEQLMDEMSDYMALFAPAFERVEQLEQSGTYLRGLLGDATRKNVEQMALGLGMSLFPPSPPQRGPRPRSKRGVRVPLYAVSLSCA